MVYKISSFDNCLNFQKQNKQKKKQVEKLIAITLEGKLGGLNSPVIALTFKQVSLMTLGLNFLTFKMKMYRV